MRKGTKIKAVADVEFYSRRDRTAWSQRLFTGGRGTSAAFFAIQCAPATPDQGLESVLCVDRRRLVDVGDVLEVACTRNAAGKRPGIVCAKRADGQAIYFERGDPRFVEVEA